MTLSSFNILNLMYFDIGVKLNDDDVLQLYDMRVFKLITVQLGLCLSS